MGTEPRVHNIDRTAIIDQIKTTELPPRIRSLADEYEEGVGNREEFLWKWLFTSFMDVTLNCVPPEHEEMVWKDKTAATIFVALLDDLAEDQQDIATFKQAMKIPFTHHHVDFGAPDVDHDVLVLAERIWSDVQQSLRKAPEYTEFADLFRFDMQQTLIAMDHSRVLNDNLAASNLTESLMHDSHNMSMVVCADMDLMYSPCFERTELGYVRDVVHCAQEAARIGNWVTTWEREVKEGDYSAGTFTWAIQEGVITPQEVAAVRRGDDDPEELIETLNAYGIESLFLDHWEQKFNELEQKLSTTALIEMGPYVEAVEQLFCHQLAAKGYK